MLVSLPELHGQSSVNYSGPQLQYDTEVVNSCTCKVFLLLMQVSTVQYGSIVLKLKEGALGDGLGARVWVVAHTLCRYTILQHMQTAAHTHTLAWF